MRRVAFRERKETGMCIKKELMITNREKIWYGPVMTVCCQLRNIILPFACKIFVKVRTQRKS